jgi:hypothetical protein
VNPSSSSSREDGAVPDGDVQGRDAYRRMLRGLDMSPALDQRMTAAIANHVSQRPQQRWLWPAAFTAAAATAAVAITLLLVRTGAPPSDVEKVAAATPTLRSPSPPDWRTAPLSPWPVDAAVVRVRGTLSTQPAELQYWLDLRLASDGSMRIVRVIPVQPHESGTHP